MESQQQSLHRRPKPDWDEVQACTCTFLPSFLLKPYSLWVETCRNRVLKSMLLCTSLALALPSPVLVPVDG